MRWSAITAGAAGRIISPKKGNVIVMLTSLSLTQGQDERALAAILNGL